MTTAETEIIAVLTEVRTLLTRKNNNYAWSYYWKNQGVATAQIDGLIDQIRSRREWDTLNMWELFQVPGPLEQMANGNQWNTSKIRQLAVRMHAAIQLYNERIYLKPELGPVKEAVSKKGSKPRLKR